jgi:RNA polymerase sigma factor (sigma-70 family)
VSIESVAAPEQTFESWVRPHLGAMARLAARLAPHADRDDVVQESLARAWLKRHQYDAARGTPAAWLLAITADQARKATRRHRGTTHEIPDGGAAPEWDARVDVRRAMRRLTDRQRLAIDCHYYAGLSMAETAAVMICAVGTVKSTLADARLRLRTLLAVTE